MRGATALHVQGRGLPDDEVVEWWIADGILRSEPIGGAETIWDGGWIIPGLVDAHCHVGLGERGAIDRAEAIAQAETERSVGALLLRDCRSPTDTRSLDDHHDLPLLQGRGRGGVGAALRRFGRGGLDQRWPGGGHASTSPVRRRERPIALR